MYFYINILKVGWDYSFQYPRLLSSLSATFDVIIIILVTYMCIYITHFFSLSLLFLFTTPPIRWDKEESDSGINNLNIIIMIIGLVILAQFYLLKYFKARRFIYVMRRYKILGVSLSAPFFLCGWITYTHKTWHIFSSIGALVYEEIMIILRCPARWCCLSLVRFCGATCHHCRTSTSYGGILL